MIFARIGLDGRFAAPTARQFERAIWRDHRIGRADEAEQGLWMPGARAIESK